MPIRTCLVTGQKIEQSQLLRFTVQDGQIVFDPISRHSERSEESLEKLLTGLQKDPSQAQDDKSIIGEQKGQARGGYVVPDPEAIQKLPKMKGKIQYFLKCKMK